MKSFWIEGLRWCTTTKIPMSLLTRVSLNISLNLPSNISAKLFSILTPLSPLTSLLFLSCRLSSSHSSLSLLRFFFFFFFPAESTLRPGILVFLDDEEEFFCLLLELHSMFGSNSNSWSEVIITGNDILSIISSLICQYWFSLIKHNFNSCKVKHYVDITCFFIKWINNGLHSQN